MEAPVIWFHAPDGARLGAVEELARRLLGEFPAAELVITGDVAAAQRKDPLDIRLIDRLGESRSDILAFLRDVTPSVLLWVGGSLHGTLLSEVEAAGLPRYLIDARQSDFEESRLPWKRMRQKAMLRRFERILAVDERAAAALAAQGARPGTVEIAGAVEESGAALPHSEA
ncbi:MAG: glycosyltransferase N-terminal domain-containing protein, partial [Pseudomonadota bacterium]